MDEDTRLVFVSPQDDATLEITQALEATMSSLTTSDGTEAILDPVLAALTSLVACDSADIRVVEGDEVRIARACGDSTLAAPAAGEETRCSLRTTKVLREAARNRRPALVRDTSRGEDEGLLPGAAGVRSQMIAPLLIDEDLVGFVTVSSASADAFVDRDRERLELLAPLAAAALHNACLCQSLAQERDRLMDLAQVDEQILAIQASAEDVMGTILGHALQLLGLTKGISILTSENDCLESVYTMGLKSPNRTEELIRANWDRVQAFLQEQGPGGAVILDHAPTTSPQLGAWAEAEEIQALLSMPLWRRENLVGCLIVLDTAARPWSERDLRIARMLGARATVAVDKALLEQRHQRRLHDAEAAFLELQHLDSMKNQFIQNTSHELRTPLAIVKGYVDLIIDGVIDISDPGDLVPALQAVQTYTDRLVALVESITTLEDSEVGNLELTPQPLQPICRAAIRANWQQAHRRHIAIEAELPDELPPVPVDAEGMLRALNQVLDNALKFSPPHSTIRLRAFVEGGHLCVQVEDEGIGIPRSELSRIFDRFYQIDGATTRRHGGMGLGLSLVKETVDRHQGEVWANSPGEGQGTTISIQLPIHRPQSASENPRSYRDPLRHEG
ncbi:MAG: ATP-binding protein, partial [Anaerolineae bacterium]